MHAMAKNGDLPSFLGRISPRGGPALRDPDCRGLMALLAATNDLSLVVNISNASALFYYALSSASAVRLKAGRRMAVVPAAGRGTVPLPAAVPDAPADNPDAGHNVRRAGAFPVEAAHGEGMTAPERRWRFRLIRSAPDMGTKVQLADGNNRSSILRMLKRINSPSRNRGNSFYLQGPGFEFRGGQSKGKSRGLEGEGRGAL